MLALVASGQVSSPSQVTVLFDASAASVAAFHFPDGATLETLAPPSAGISPVVIVLAVATFGLIFIGLVSVAGFTVMAQRRLRSLGATDRNVHLVLVANGAVVGIVATLIGAVIGFLGWIAYVPHLQTSAGHRIDALNLPWWAIGTAMALAAVPGITLLVVGPCLLAFAGGWGGNSGKDTLLLLTGIVATTLGGLLLAPLCITGLAAVGRRGPIAIRLALHDLARYRARSGAALAAVTFAVLIAVLICILATARYADPVDYFGPSLPANQLIVYAPGGNPRGPGDAPPAPTPSERQRLRSRVSVIAASLDTNDVLELDAPMNPATGNTALLLQDMVSGGQPYVATPALLTHYGIKPNQIDPTADLLTSHAGLATVAGLQLIAPSGFGPGSFGCHPSDCVSNPKIQTLSRLPADTSGPNLLITTNAMHELGLQAVPSGWLMQTARPLTSAQINAARHISFAAGATTETKSQAPSLLELRNWATAAGILLALGVLAMTVGLIRARPPVTSARSPPPGPTAGRAARSPAPPPAPSACSAACSAPPSPTSPRSPGTAAASPPQSATCRSTTSS